MPVGALYLLLAASCALGIWRQRRPGSEQLRERLWQLNYVVVLPAAAVYAFCSIRLDGQLLAIVGCSLTAWWLTLALAGAWSRIGARDRPHQGALWMVGAFPNTGFIGFPLAQLAFGLDGLRLAVIYDQVSLVVPAIVVAMLIARGHAPASTTHPAQPGIAATMLRSPPLWTVLAVLALRLTMLPDPVQLTMLGSIVGLVVGPLGFVLLGLSIPLGGFTHDVRELVATSVAVLIRIAAAPLVLLAIARGTGVQLPPALLLIAAMPTAFHALIIARLNGVAPEVVRLGVLLSTVVVGAGVVAAVLLGYVPGHA